MGSVKKLRSPAIEAAETRLSGLVSIDPNLVLSPELSVKLFGATIEATRTQLTNLNTEIADLRQARDRFKLAERNLRDLTSRMLAGVESVYKRDSDQYVKAGGTRPAAHRRRKGKNGSNGETTPEAKK